MKFVTIGNRAPFANEDGVRAKALLDRPRGGGDVRTVERHDDARGAVRRDHFHLDARRAQRFSRYSRVAAMILCGILIGHQSKAELRAGFGGNRRLAHLL